MDNKLLYEIICCFIFAIIDIAFIWRYDIKRNNSSKELQIYLKETSIIKKLYLISSVLVLIILAIALHYIYGSSNSMIFNIKRIALVSVLYVAAYTDFKNMIIPNGLILTGGGYWCVLAVLEVIFERDLFLDRIVAEMIAVFVIIIMCALCLVIVKNGVGMGDVKLLLLMSLFQGIDGIAGSIFMSLLVAFVISIVLLASHKKNRKDAIPFAPSIIIGSFISIILLGV